MTTMLPTASPSSASFPNGRTSLGFGSQESLQDSSRRGGTVAFADQCILIPVGYAANKGSYSGEPPRDPASSSTRSQVSLPLTGLQQILLNLVQSDHPSHAPLSLRPTHRATEDLALRLSALREISQLRHKRSWSSSDLPLLVSGAQGPDLDQQTRLTRAERKTLPKGILKRPTQSREGSLVQRQRKTSSSRPPPSAGPPLTPIKTTPQPSFQATLQCPTPQKPVATPRAAYRPLDFGRSSDDEDDMSTSPPSASPLLLPTTVPTRSREGPRDGEGPPVVHVPRSARGFGMKRQVSLESTARYGPGSSLLYRNKDFAHSSPALLASPDAQPSTAARPATPPSGSTAGQPRPPSQKVDATAPSAISQPTSLTRSVSASSHLVRSTSGNRRPEWLRKSKRSALPVPGDAGKEAESAGTESGDTDDRVIDTAQLVPLITTCVCPHCEGRISAGLSATYVPHWSKAARSKWLADRRQVAQSASSADQLKTQPLNLSGSIPGLVTSEAVRQPRFVRSPPPTLSSQSEDRLANAVGSHQSSRGKVTYHPLQRAQPPQPAVGLGDDSDGGYEDPDADLQRILRGQGDEDISSDTIQVDEVDKKRGSASQPGLLGGRASPDLRAFAQGVEVNGGLSVPRRSTPLGLNEDEAIDGDASLAHQVELEIRAREEKARNEIVRKRGGARGMLAMLEEADTEEAIAREQRLQRVASPPDRHPSSLMVGIEAGASALNGIATPPIGRSSSPLFDRLKGTFRSSSRNSSRSAQSDDGKQSVAPAPRSAPLTAPNCSSTAASKPRKSARRASEGLLTPSVNHSHFAVRPQVRSETAGLVPQTTSRAIAEESTVPHSAARVRLSATAPRLSSDGLIVPNKEAKSGLSRSQSLSNRNAHGTGTDLQSRSVYGSGPASTTPHVSKTFGAKDREKVVFGTAWNPSLSSSASSLQSASTPPEWKRNSTVIPGQLGLSSVSAPAGVKATVAMPSPTSSLDSRPTSIKRSATLQHGPTSTVANPSRPEASERRSVSQGQVSKPNSRSTEAKGAPSNLVPVESTAAATGPVPSPSKTAVVTEERLKKRSLRRRLSAPISAAKGFFEQRSS